MDEASIQIFGKLPENFNIQPKFEKTLQPVFCYIPQCSFDRGLESGSGIAIA